MFIGHAVRSGACGYDFKGVAPRDRQDELERTELVTLTAREGQPWRYEEDAHVSGRVDVARSVVRSICVLLPWMAAVHGEGREPQIPRPHHLV